MTYDSLAVLESKGFILVIYGFWVMACYNFLGFLEKKEKKKKRPPGQNTWGEKE